MLNFFGLIAILFTNRLFVILRFKTMHLNTLFNNLNKQIAASQLAFDTSRESESDLSLIRAHTKTSSQNLKSFR